MPEPKASNITLTPPPVVESPEEIEARKRREISERVQQGRYRQLHSYGEVRGKGGGPKPTDKHYAWINSHPIQITKFKALGYVICDDDRIETNYFSPATGTHICGDTTLMYCDQDYYEALKLDSAYRAIEGVEGENIFHAFAGRVGIPVSNPK